MRNFDENPPTSKNHLDPLKFLDLSLRISVIPLSAASIWVTVTNKQDSSSYGKIDFTNLTGLEYMVCVNAISAGYGIVAVIFSWLRGLFTKAWFFFLSDQVVAYLMVTSAAAVIEILYLAYNGDKDVSWSEACSSYGRFCSRVKVALVLHALALLFFLVLSLISTYRVFSRYQPPYVASEDMEERRINH
ncbi:PREDICTED: CASP-like protein 2D1 [Nelumbo nucifera]|uniref:CASP-like protein n=1 Tax=Nelumbo nucifera TaxID=4432 RepID=A0A1U8BGT4_NELNU|nr:PREDICTED: CASP-like protein 2D1 [Nelumbo nucifera]